MATDTTTDQTTTTTVSPVSSRLLSDQILNASGNQPVRDQLDTLSRAGATGTISSAISDTFYGINHRQTPNAIPINRDYYGLTLLTRPRLNMTTENLRTTRFLSMLLTNDATSVQRAIRCTLDPMLSVKNTGITSPLVDQSMAFIPLLTNHLTEMSGWPDLEAKTFTSHEGIYNESFSMIDSVFKNYTTYDITATFRNIPGDPITLLFLCWIYYASAVYLGELAPYPDAIIQNEIDYNTRIYRLILDESKRRVQGIAATIAFPWSVPIGAKFNFNSDRPLVANTDQLTFNFRCAGAEYNDTILVDEFNRTVQMFNPSMKDSNRTSAYVNIPIDALPAFNNRGYPRINPDTYELEWWISKTLYTQMLPIYSAKQKAAGQS